MLKFSSIFLGAITFLLLDFNEALEYVLTLEATNDTAPMEFYEIQIYRTVLSGAQCTAHPCESGQPNEFRVYIPHPHEIRYIIANHRDGPHLLTVPSVWPRSRRGEDTRITLLYGGKGISRARTWWMASVAQCQKVAMLTILLVLLGLVHLFR